MTKILSIATLTLSLLVSGLSAANAEGNRKVNITVSGWVAPSTMWWDESTSSHSPNQGSQTRRNLSTKRSLNKNRGTKSGKQDNFFYSHSYSFQY